MVSRRFLVLTAVWLVSHSADARKLPLRVFTVADGLPQNEITCLLEDSRGFFWVGTSDGLARFDGRSFTTYGVAEGLPHPGINDILEAPDGALWLATGGGVARFSVIEPSAPAKAIRTYRLSEAPGGNLVFRLYRDRMARLWAGTANGLFVLEPGASSFHEVRLDLPKPPKVTMVNADAFSESPGGDLWVGTTWALIRILPDHRKLRYLPSDPHRPSGVRDLHFDGAGRLWICWDRGVTVYRPVLPPAVESVVFIPSPIGPCVGPRRVSPGPGESCEISEPDPAPEFFGEVHESRSGEIRLVAGHGLFQAEPEGLRRDETAASFARNILTCLLEDNHGSFWIGTQTGGLARIARNGLWTYGSEDGLLKEMVNAVFENPAGELCVVTNGGGLHQFRDGRFVGVVPALPSSITYLGWGWAQVAFQDRAGDWWYATGEGVARYPPTPKIEELARTLPKSIYTNRDGLPGNNVFRLHEDSRGDVWIATIGAGAEGLARWERSTERIRVEPIGADLLPVSAIGEDLAGDLWIGSYRGGLARLRDGRWEAFSPEAFASRGFISQIYRDTKGRMWIATRVGGLIRVDDPTSAHPSFRACSREQGLASDRASAVTEDIRGNVYIANSSGIDRLDPATGRIRHYTAAEGLASTKTESAFRDRSGRLWFGTSNGLFCFEPRPEEPGLPPRVFLQAVEAGGKRYPVAASGSRTLELTDLPNDRNRLRIEFVSPSLSPAEQIRFRYRLEGRGGGWSDLSSDRSVQYASLSPGRYTFRVEAIASDGTRSREPASLGFRILPPVWQRWWFLSAAGLALAGALAWLHRQRVERLLAVERVRSRIAADLHDDLGTSLYRISILSELADRKVGDTPSETRPLLSEIGQTARDLIESAGDMVWSVDPRRDNLSDLIARVRHYASEILEAQGVLGSLEGPDGAERISLAAETRRQLYLIFKEAIRNALRHGRPSHVAMRLAVNDGRLQAEIHDDGAGISSGHLSDGGEEPAGYGLGTMRRRAESLGGVFRVTSGPGEGTRIFIDVPLQGA